MILRVRFFTKIRDRIENVDNKDFSLKKNAVTKKGLFFINFHRKDPQYRQYPGERITRLLMMLQEKFADLHFILDG